MAQLLFTQNLPFKLLLKVVLPTHIPLMYLLIILLYRSNENYSIQVLSAIFPWYCSKIRHHYYVKIDLHHQHYYYLLKE
jgi:hypothetical protein